MRIALFHNTPSGGAKRAIYEWIRRLAKSHEIDVFTLSSADCTFCDIRPFAQRYRSFDFAPSKLFDSPLGRLNRLQRWRDLGQLTRIGRETAREIDAGSYDVVFANTCFYTFIPAFLQFLETPAVYYLHEPFGLTFVRRFQRPHLENKWWQQLLNSLDPLIGLYDRRLETMQRRSIHQTRRLLANSYFTKQIMKTAFRVEAPVCYCGVNSEDFRPLPGIRKQDYVISVGELSPRKGFDFIVETLRQIPSEERPKLRLVCNTVDPLERDFVERLADANGVELEILTNLGADDLAVAYNEARLCVYAPLLEPFGLVPLEAMSCGTPVVGVREGGVQESILHEHTGLLVSRDPTMFAAAIQRLLSDPEVASDYGRNGRETVLRSWTWDQSAATLEEYLKASAQKG